jgi:pepF/M3 family oligoendopeptidase
LRRRAYEAELAAWEETAVPLVAALNSIKGEQVLLAKERGWTSPLDAALADNNIDTQTLEALLVAVQEAFPDFQRYLRAKAQLLGLPQLAWYDLYAPVGENGENWPYKKAKKFIVEQFGTYSPKMADLARQAFQKGWIDAQPRAGKIDVSYCARFQNGESRILVNFKPTFFEVTILAHELGHAYHNLNLAQRTALQRETPLTLAETASTFCQRLVQTGGIQQADTEEQITILEASLQLTTMMVVEVTTWLFFEKAVCEKRGRGELSLESLKQLMLDAQRQSYGDSLDPDALHPFIWTAWPHQYWSSFYNFQYTFGTLFALGLYQRYQADPDHFQAGYDDLLAATGMDDAAGLAARFDIDIRSADFWRASLAVVRADIDRFETAVVAHHSCDPPLPSSQLSLSFINQP